MRDLADRLESLASDGVARGADSVFRSAVVEAAQPDRGRVGRGVWPVVVSVVGVLVLVGAVVAVVARDDDSKVRTPTSKDQRVPTVTGSSDDLLRLFDTSGEVPAGPDPLFLVPAHVPDGFTLLHASGGNQPGKLTSAGGTLSVERVQTWIHVVRGAPNPEVAFLELSWSEPQPAGAVYSPPGDNRTPVTVNGHAGRLGAGAGVVASLLWQDADGRVVTMSADALTSDELLAAAESVQPRGDGGVTMTSPPDGYQLAVETPGMRSAGTNPRALVYSDGAGSGVRIYITSDTEHPPGLDLQLPDGMPSVTGDPLTRHVETVRERPALVANVLMTGGVYGPETLFLSDPTVAVQWLEPANVAVVVSSVGLSEHETLAVARSLYQADQSEWDQLVARAPGRDGAAPVPDGPSPTFTGTDAEIQRAFLAWLDADTTDDVVAAIEDGDVLRPTIEAAEAQASAPRSTYTGTVDAIQHVPGHRALVTYSLLQDGQVLLANQQGAAVLTDGKWRVSRETYCALIAISDQVRCPGDNRNPSK